MDRMNEKMHEHVTNSIATAGRSPPSAAPSHSYALIVRGTNEGMSSKDVAKKDCSECGGKRRLES